MRAMLIKILVAPSFSRTRIQRCYYTLSKFEARQLINNPLFILQTLYNLRRFKLFEFYLTSIRNLIERSMPAITIRFLNHHLLPILLSNTFMNLIIYFVYLVCEFSLSTLNLFLNLNEVHITLL